MEEKVMTEEMEMRVSWVKPERIRDSMVQSLYVEINFWQSKDLSSTMRDGNTQYKHTGTGDWKFHGEKMQIFPSAPIFTMELSFPCAMCTGSRVMRGVGGEALRKEKKWEKYQEEGESKLTWKPISTAWQGWISIQDLESWIWSENGNFSQQPQSWYL